MFPSSLFGRLSFVVWLTACVALLILGYVQQDIHDMPVAFILLLIYVTFPAGLLGVTLVGLVWPVITSFLGITYQPFYDILPYWLVAVALGYVQWVIVVPWVIHKVSRASNAPNHAFKRDAEKRGAP
jgi:hypothetical protein